MNTSLPKLLITGGKGQVASALCHTNLTRASQLIALDRSELDITENTSIERALSNHHPDVIINTAAYTAVDKAEQDKDACLKANYLGAKTLAIACARHRIPLIHLSTDYVFAGDQQKPYTETTATHPINFYGKSKLLGEMAVREHCEQHVILRVSGVFSAYGNNFLKTILRLAAQQKTLRIIADQLICPTYAGSIAQAIFSLLQHQFISGTYHYCSATATSWHAFATAILETAVGDEKKINRIEAITTANYPTPAKRPLYSVMDCSKIAADYGIMQPSWREDIKAALFSMIPSPVNR